MSPNPVVLYKEFFFFCLPTSSTICKRKDDFQALPDDNNPREDHDNKKNLKVRGLDTNVST